MVLRRSKRQVSAVEENNRLSLISNDSSISMSSRFSGNSSLGSMSSYADSCYADSNSDLSVTRYSSQILTNDRTRTVTAIYSPSSEPKLDTPRLGDSPDERDEDDQSQITPEERDMDGSFKAVQISHISRKSVSTSQLQRAPGLVTTLTRAQSAITAVCIEDDTWNTVLRRPSTSEEITPTGER